MTLTGEPMLDAALLAGGAGAVRALLAAWSQREAVDHAKLAKNILLAFLVGAGVAYTGLPQAEILGALTALGVVDMAERTAKGIDGRVRKSPLGGPAKALTDLLDELRLAALAERTSLGSQPGPFYGLSLDKELVMAWAEPTASGLEAAMDALARVEPFPDAPVVVDHVPVKDLEEE